MGSSQSTNFECKLISNKAQAELLLNYAEQQDRYIEECNEDIINNKARINCTYKPNKISSEDISYYQHQLENTLKYVPKRLKMDLDDVYIIPLMPSAEGGMPHTRPTNIICFPDISHCSSQITLIHELWHIHQREFKDVWNRVFQNLGWKIWNGTLPLHLESNRRYNPDTIDEPLWIFRDKWVPIPIFKDISHPKMNQVYIWFYNPIENYHVTKIPNEMIQYFPGLPSTAYEHPREITAYMLSEYTNYLDSPSFTELLLQIGNLSISN
jgi:hypothetical protein